MKWAGLWAAAAALLCFACAPTDSEVSSVSISGNLVEKNVPISDPPPNEPMRITQPMEGVPGAVRLWVNKADPPNSLFFALDESGAGHMVVYELNGRVRERIGGFGFPRDVDVQTDVQYGDGYADIVGVVDRSKHSVRFFIIDKERLELHEITGHTEIFEKQPGGAGAAMAIALYRRSDGKTYALVSRKVSDGGGALWQYELSVRDGRIDLTKVREFGEFGRESYIRAIAVDDAAGYVYYYDRSAGIRKYFADPDRKDPNREIAHFAQSGVVGEVTGLSIYEGQQWGTGYICVLDQQASVSTLRLYRREGQINNPHDQGQQVESWNFLAPSSLGMDTTATALDPKKFPEGLIVMSSPSDSAYRFFSWEQARMAPIEFGKEMRRRNAQDQSQFNR